MQGIYSYYLIAMLASFALARPWFAGIVVVLFLLRNKLPGPRRWLEQRARRLRLERQAELNPANLLVRRDLALLAVERKQGATALRYADEALVREPKNPELLLARAEALVMLGRHGDAIPALVAVNQVDARTGFGRTFQLAAECLEHTGQLPEAIDAAERYVKVSTSDPNGYLCLAHLRAKTGDAAGATQALADGKRLTGTSIWAIPGTRRAWSKKDTQSALVAVGVLVVALVLGSALRGSTEHRGAAPWPSQQGPGSNAYNQE